MKLSCRTGPLRLPPHERRPVRGDPDSGGRSHAFLIGLAGSLFWVLPLVGIIFLLIDAFFSIRRGSCG
jgi:hypothetical protein